MSSIIHQLQSAQINGRIRKSEFKQYGFTRAFLNRSYLKSEFPVNGITSFGVWRNHYYILDRLIVDTALHCFDEMGKLIWKSELDRADYSFTVTHEGIFGIKRQGDKESLILYDHQAGFLVQSFNLPDSFCTMDSAFYDPFKKEVRIFGRSESHSTTLFVDISDLSNTRFQDYDFDIKPSLPISGECNSWSMNRAAINCCKDLGHQNVLVIDRSASFPVTCYRATDRVFAATDGLLISNEKSWSFSAKERSFKGEWKTLDYGRLATSLCLIIHRSPWIVNLYQRGMQAVNVYEPNSTYTTEHVKVRPEATYNPYHFPVFVAGPFVGYNERLSPRRMTLWDFSPIERGNDPVMLFQPERGEIKGLTQEFLLYESHYKNYLIDVTRGARIEEDLPTIGQLNIEEDVDVD